MRVIRPCFQYIHNLYIELYPFDHKMYIPKRVMVFPNDFVYTERHENMHISTRKRSLNDEWRWTERIIIFVHLSINIQQWSNKQTEHSYWALRAMMELVPHTRCSLGYVSICQSSNRISIQYIYQWAMSGSLWVRERWKIISEFYLINLVVPHTLFGYLNVQKNKIMSIQIAGIHK